MNFARQTFLFPVYYCRGGPGQSDGLAKSLRSRISDASMWLLAFAARNASDHQHGFGDGAFASDKAIYGRRIADHDAAYR